MSVKNSLLSVTALVATKKYVNLFAKRQTGWLLYASFQALGCGETTPSDFVLHFISAINGDNHAQVPRCAYRPRS
jgi:hypothetical protein